MADEQKAPAVPEKRPESVKPGPYKVTNEETGRKTVYLGKIGMRVSNNKPNNK